MRPLAAGPAGRCKRLEVCLELPLLTRLWEAAQATGGWLRSSPSSRAAIARRLPTSVRPS